MMQRTDLAPGEVPRAGRRPAMLALAAALALGWLYYLLVLDVQLARGIDAALAMVPSGFARVLKALTLFAIFLVPALGGFLLLARIGALMDAPGPSPAQMLEAVQEGHRRAIAQSRELMEAQLAKLPPAEAARLRTSLEENLQRAIADAALREQRYAADPALMEAELRATIATARTGRLGG